MSTELVLAEINEEQRGELVSLASGLSIITNDDGESFAASKAPGEFFVCLLTVFANCFNVLWI